MFRTFMNRCKSIVSTTGTKQMRNMAGLSTFTVLGTSIMTTSDTSDYVCPNDVWTESTFDDDFDVDIRAKLLRQKINCKSKESMTSQAEMEKFGPALHDNWEVHEIDDKYHLKRDFYVDTIDEVKDICNLIFDVAERSNYHPDITVKGHKVISVDLYSFRLDGLRIADFIVAARIDVEIEKLVQQYDNDSF
eukprot:789383_1